jgi:hypothetical protein
VPLDRQDQYPERRLFIDSGAFSEVSTDPKQHKKAGLKPEKGVLKTVAPISEEDWAERFDLMERVGKVWGPRLMVMAPDKIADQQETLRRLRWFKRSGWLDRMRRTGAEIALVLQGGELSPLEFERKAAKALGWNGYMVAFPMKKGATRIEVIEDYMQRRAVPRVHLLGIGPKGRKEGNRPSAAMVRKRLFARYPRVRWSWDSTMVRQAAGGTAKIKKGKAPYSKAKRELRKDLLPYSWQRMDFTELGSEPSLWLLPLWGWPKAQKCMAELLEAGGEQLRIFQVGDDLTLAPHVTVTRKRRRPMRADTKAQRAAWRRKRATWAKCRAEFEAEAFKTGRRIGVPEEELALFAYDPDNYVYSRFPNLAGGWNEDHPRYVHDPYFHDAIENEFGRWLATTVKSGKHRKYLVPEVQQFLNERAVYRAFREREIEIPGQRLVAGLRL